MKTLPILLLFVTLSLTAAAQFPLGSTMPKIKAYFYKNVPYSAVQEFKTDDGDVAICFTKVKVVGDFTFYFDHNGICTSYVETYGRRDLNEVESLLDHKYCRLDATRWISEEGKFDAVISLPTIGANYFSVTYTSKPLLSVVGNTLVTN